MKKGFISNGKIWNDELETELKTIVADSFTSHSIENSLISAKATSIDALVDALNAKLS